MTQMNELMQQMVNVWGAGLIHHDNLGLYDSGEITEHYSPFHLCDLIMISLYNKGYVNHPDEKPQNLHYSPLSLTPLILSILLCLLPLIPIPTAIALGQTPIICSLNCCIGLFIVLPTFTLFPMTSFFVCGQNGP